MRLLLLGGSGQVGRELRRSLAALAQVQVLSRQDADFMDLARRREAVRDCRARLVVNVAAFTDVDTAETPRRRV